MRIWGESHLAVASGTVTGTKQKMLEVILLYPPTQIRFPIGGDRVMRHGLKLTNSLPGDLVT